METEFRFSARGESAFNFCVISPGLIKQLSSLNHMTLHEYACIVFVHTGMHGFICEDIHVWGALLCVSMCVEDISGIWYLSSSLHPFFFFVTEPGSLTDPRVYLLS